MVAPPAWAHLPFFASDLPLINAALAADTREVLPATDQVFAAFALPPGDVRVLILGQDPYPTRGHPNGLAFSVAPDVSPLPRSLGNIFKELRDDMGDVPPNGDLSFWTTQGVMLLNTSLTVPEGHAGAHVKLGWANLTRQVLDTLDSVPRAFVLWGRHAQSVAAQLTNPNHLQIRTAHPSPLSARRGFFGSRPFSKVNAWLNQQGLASINWTTP